MLSQPVPTLSQPQWHLHGSKDLKERYDSSPTNRPHWHKHKKEELRWPPGLPEACDLAFHNQDRLLQRGALDAAQCHRAFGQVLLRLFPQGAPAGRPAALLDRAFSESDQDLDGLLLLQEFHFFVLRGLQPILTGAAQQSPAAQAAALQSAQLAAQAFATQTKMPTPELTKTPPPEAASPSSAWTPQGLKDCAPGGSVVKVAAHGPSARHLSVMLQEYEIPEVYESLGSGAFGTVLKVRHTGTGELRACKAVQLQNGSEALKELVELEVTMLKSLDHLNLLRLFEAFRDGDRCVYLVTELCAGGSLAERLEQQRRRDPKHFGTSYSPLLEDLFSTVTMLRVIAGAVIMATSFTLMGCGGCNQDALTSCAQTYNSDPTISAGTDAVCKTWQTYTSCVKDAACCDFDIESDGTTKAWKDYLDSLLTMKDSLCTGSNAVSNQCS
ncbi:Calcium-dependent protein kinase 5 (PbCDPK5) [Durusdinium trenchii]|uniref:non-specific serine/threonine protein kinase n=3 Tax=Durusdinium trenchii TaxID=1381693 RepID=A0ABP0QUN8_9DINO